MLCRPSASCGDSLAAVPAWDNQFLKVIMARFRVNMANNAFLHLVLVVYLCKIFSSHYMSKMFNGDKIMALVSYCLWPKLGI